MAEERERPRKALNNKGKAKVKFEVSFSPSRGATATQAKSVVLKKSS